MIGVPEANGYLGHLALLLELKQRGQHLGGLTVVLPDVAAAGRNHLVRQRHAEAPLQHVQLVDALVSDLAVAEIPSPVPVVMHMALGVGAPFARANPEIVIEGRWSFLVGLGL